MRNNLRKQALLESGKTVSRKARSKQGTPSTSRAPSVGATPSSRRASNVPSRTVSDDEVDSSDESNSLDSLVFKPPVGEDEAPEIWISNLEERITAVLERKRSSVQSREEALAGLCSDLMRHYAIDVVTGRTDELVSMLLKSVKSGVSEKEVVLALKALALLLITEPDEKLYDAVSTPIKATIMHAQHPAAKIAGIAALSIATFYGGASTEETEEVMSFYQDIASSDGAVLDEPDNPGLVTAALQEWGFLATQLEDLEDATELAMDAFVDQLDSVHVDVQIAAGENIALLFERSYTAAESDDDEDVVNDLSTLNIHGARNPHMISRYTVYRQLHQLEATLSALAKSSSKRQSKKDRKALHLAFADILNTVERPTRGPRYSTALDEDGKEFGSRLKVTVAPGVQMTIDKWWKLHRLQGIKRLLQGGFVAHYELNAVVLESLPVELEEG